MAMTELKDPEKVFGVRKGITFKCGACKCGFFQEMRFIRFYVRDGGVYRYIIQTECPNCKGIVAVAADGHLE